MKEQADLTNLQMREKGTGKQIKNYPVKTLKPKTQFFIDQQ